MANKPPELKRMYHQLNIDQRNMHVICLIVCIITYFVLPLSEDFKLLMKTLITHYVITGLPAFYFGVGLFRYTGVLNCLLNSYIEGFILD